MVSELFVLLTLFHCRYPDAKVICSVRDEEKWAASMEFLSRTVNPKHLVFIFYWIKNLRYCAVLWTLLRDHFIKTYGKTADSRENARFVWEKHHQWLEEIVRLV